MGDPFMPADRYGRALPKCSVRGTGAELWVLGADPDKGEAGARQAGPEIPQPSKDVPHGWRDVIVVDREGYICAVGMPLKSLG